MEPGFPDGIEATLACTVNFVSFNRVSKPNAQCLRPQTSSCGISDLASEDILLLR